MNDKKKTEPQALLGRHPGEPVVPDYYANFVSANVSPFELNLNLGRAAIPVNGAEGQEYELTDNITFLARVAIPLSGLPLIVELLKRQLEAAYERGYLVRKTDKVVALEVKK